MYTEETILYFGKHKGKILRDVPPSYLVSIFDSSAMHHRPELRDYIKARIDKLRSLTGGSLAAKLDNIDYENSGLFICAKRAFPTKRDALDSIVKPQKRRGKWKHNKKQPVRAYECKKCNYWHLTSISFEEYQNRKKYR